MKFTIKCIRYGHGSVEGDETLTIEATEFVIEDNLLIFRRYGLSTHNEVVDFTNWDRIEVKPS